MPFCGELPTKIYIIKYLHFHLEFTYATYTLFDSFIHSTNINLTSTGDPKINNKLWPLPLQNLQSSNEDKTKNKNKKEQVLCQKFVIFEGKERKPWKQVTLIKHHVWPCLDSFIFSDCYSWSNMTHLPTCFTRIILYLCSHFIACPSFP